MVVQAGLSTNGLVMPPDFPGVPYEAIHMLITAKLPASDPRFHEYACGWNAVSHRFLAAGNYSDAYTTSIRNTSNARSVVGQHQQETALFGFFTSGLAVLEATYYALHAIGSMLRPADFPITPRKLKGVTPSSTCKAYEAAFHTDPIIAVLNGVINDTAYQELKDIRNVIAHRIVPGRQTYQHVSTRPGSGHPPPEEWKLPKALPLNDRLTAARRADLASLLSDLLGGAESFVTARF